MTKRYIVEVTLTNGITDVTIVSMNYNDVNEVYEDFNNSIQNKEFVYFKMEDIIVSYRCKDISMIKVMTEDGTNGSIRLSSSNSSSEEVKEEKFSNYTNKMFKRKRR